ncbi:interleukin-9 [Callorhinus ursinus]|uniref:Interleukin-9 n=2 Tax=Otariidae TaxID=9702 RepID=A0A3Q7N5C8_CALUR|nr:interleukin-9 [Callorhinus ursinus]XP_027463012.1 interleukin-9 [Zalophus californianus]XP_027959253.1 interleukin-9 [Eumetopias jubatus]
MLLPTVVLASALLLCSVTSQRCQTFTGIQDVTYLIDKLQEHPASKCTCSSANVTNCLCLPIPSDNCTTACFQEGLSQITNSTAETRYHLIFNRVKKIVQVLKNNKCQFFSCGQPCNQTTTGNTLTFLRSLQETFQKQRVLGKV